MFGGFGVQQQQFQSKNADHIVQNSPSDTVSSISFSATNQLFVAGSWSKELFLYEIGQGGAQARNKMVHGSAILCTSFHPDSLHAFSGGTDNTVKLWDLKTGSQQVIGRHDAPVKECAFVGETGMLATASWDRTLKFWDCRSPAAVGTMPLTDRAYCMDVKHPVLVVGTADRKFLVYDLRQNTLFKTAESPLKFQSRALSIFVDKTGFATGSVEGRVGIQHLQDRDKEKNFAFKCHRSEQNEVFSVNCLTFHNYGTFATAGSDGLYTFWDKDVKQRLKGFNREAVPITAATFNPAGTIYAYALGYDWHRGIDGWEKFKNPNVILLHKVEDAEVKPKPKGK